jgi:hypothetical protein
MVNNMSIRIIQPNQLLDYLHFRNQLLVIEAKNADQ